MAKVGGERGGDEEDRRGASSCRISGGTTPLLSAAVSRNCLHRAICSTYAYKAGKYSGKSADRLLLLLLLLQRRSRASSPSRPSQVARPASASSIDSRFVWFGCRSPSTVRRIARGSFARSAGGRSLRTSTLAAPLGFADADEEDAANA